MPLVIKDRVQETTTTTGTGTITLAGAVSGFQSFSAIGDGNTTFYSIVGGTQWELGIGTYTSSSTTLSRDTILESSTGGSAVNFSAGTKTVFCTYPAERSVYVDGSSITPGASATLPVSSGGTGSSTAAFSGANITSLNASSVSSGTLSAANGGTGQTSLTANNVILGNGTSGVQFVAPGTSSNVLTSNGSTWISSAAAGGGGFTRGTTTSLSGNSVDLSVTSSTANMIVVAIANLSGSGTSIPIIRVAADGFLIASSTLYASVQLAIPSGATPGGTSNTSGWAMNNASAAANGLSGTFVLSKLSNYVYTAQAIWGVTAGSQANLRCQLSSGYIDINTILVGGAPIDRVRLTFVNGTDSFDGGSASIFWQ